MPKNYKYKLPRFGSQNGSTILQNTV